MASPELLDGKRPVGLRIRAMQYYQVDAPWVGEAVGPEGGHRLSVVGTRGDGFLLH